MKTDLDQTLRDFHGHNNNSLSFATADFQVSSHHFLVADDRPAAMTTHTDSSFYPGSLTSISVTHLQYLPADFRRRTLAAWPFNPRPRPRNSAYQPYHVDRNAAIKLTPPITPTIFGRVALFAYFYN